MFSRTLRRAAVAAALALPLVIAACTSPTGVRPEHRAALLRARAQWAALGADSYTFVVGPRCYCGVQEIRTTVVDGVATERVFVETGSPVPGNLFSTIATVDAMLAHIEKAIDDEVAELDAAYDERGVPVEVQIDYMENAIDEEFGWVVKSLTITP
jgi:hypothetical protein